MCVVHHKPSTHYFLFVLFIPGLWDDASARLVSVDFLVLNILFDADRSQCRDSRVRLRFLGGSVAVPRVRLRFLGGAIRYQGCRNSGIGSSYRQSRQAGLHGTLVTNSVSRRRREPTDGDVDGLTGGRRFLATFDRLTFPLRQVGNPSLRYETRRLKTKCYWPAHRCVDITYHPFFTELRICV